MCKIMYFNEYKPVTFLFKFCMEWENSLRGRFLFFMSMAGFNGNGNLKGNIFMHYTVYGYLRETMCRVVRELLDLSNWIATCIYSKSK